MKQRRPAPSEHSQYLGRYIGLVDELDVLGAMEKQSTDVQRMLARVGESRGDYRYAPDKWTIKQVVGHVEDCERVFAYRAISIARGDTTPLPGFDEKIWMAHAPFDSTSLASRAEALQMVRRTSISMFRDLDDAAWDRAGTASDSAISVRALAYTIVGHARHHINILRERYAIAT